MSKYRMSSAILVVTSLILLFVTPIALTQTTPISQFTAQYIVLNQKLYISIQLSLIAYYNNMSDAILRDSDYAKLITPQAVQPIADSILKITRDMPYSEEQFANAVLAMVHQIPYNITGAKYPVETIVDNVGDCGAVSVLAASIMKAGGLDVVLIKYNGIDPGHMNVGVYLPHTPIYHSLLMSPTGFEYNNKTYWTAEATPQGDWKVGDQSLSMTNAIAQIIPIDNCEVASPGQITTSIGIPLQDSQITINLSQQPTAEQEKKRALLISGTTQPATPNSSITLFINENGKYTNYTKIDTDSAGNYSYLWNFTKDGTYFISTSWVGNGTSLGVDSETLIAFIGPQALVQFENDRGNYIIGIPISDIAIRRFIGIEEFLNIPIGTNVSVSYSFTVLQTGSAEPGIPTEKVTIPTKEYKITLRRAADPEFVKIPSKTITVPTAIPPGMTALSLPDDFNQTINSKFCLVIEENQNNTYSLNAKGLNDYDLSEIVAEKETQNTFLNATEEIEKSIWYKVTTTITDKGINANIQREDGTPIESLSASKNSNKQLVLLIANNVDSAVILSDLKVGAVNAAPRTLDNPTATPGITVITFPYYLYVIVIIAALASAVVYFAKRKPSSLNTQNLSH